MQFCPECGARYENSDTCQSIFDSFLVLEFTDPEYGVVHFLTVACFMIQHNRYSDRGLLSIEQKLREYLDGGKDTEQIRREARRETGRNVRDWQILRPAEAKTLPRVNWSCTILDVANTYEGASGYRDEITHWARTTLMELQPIIEFIKKGE